MIGLLKFLGLASNAALILVLALGYASSFGYLHRGIHMAAGLIGALIAILWLSTAMFYFIATGSAVKDAVKKKLADFEDYQKTKEFKKSLFPLLMTAIAFLILSPVMGAAYDAKKAPLLTHTILSWLTLGLTVAFYFRSVKLLIVNQPIFMRTVEAVNAEVEKTQKRPNK